MNLNFMLGTAAELIKVFPLLRMAEKRGHAIRVISSGQSRENFLMQYRDLELKREDLRTLLTSDGDLQKASSALRWFFRAVRVSKKKFRADLIGGAEPNTYLIVHGDTLTTLAGAWLGWRCGLRVVHIEAGLRSPHLFNPFPEEITRRLVSRFADMNMAPDQAAVNNLSHVRGRVVNTNGNTLIDAVFSNDPARGALPSKPYALVNIHRFENLNSSARWQKSLDTVARAAEKIHVIFVVHPQTRHKLEHDENARKVLARPNIEVRDRMTFSRFLSLLKNCEYLISDGGSNQEECSYLGKPCLLLRESTERSEGLDGCCVLSRFESNVIDDFMRDPKKFARAPLAPGLSPSSVIIEALSEQEHEREPVQ